MFTLGRRREAQQNVLAPGDVEVIEIERGGDVTYHGPGQLVAYPIVLLEEAERDLHKFLRNLEEAVIADVRARGLDADREPGKTGVWTTDRARPQEAVLDGHRVPQVGDVPRPRAQRDDRPRLLPPDQPVRLRGDGDDSLAQLQPAVDPAAVRAALVEELGARARARA